MEQSQYETIVQEVQKNNQGVDQPGGFFNVFFIIVIILIVLIFGFTFVMIFSSKARGKMMSKQVKSLKHMMDDSAADIEALGATLGGVSARTKKRVLDENEDILADVSQREANIKKGYVKTMARAVKEGLSEADGSAFCKHCGAIIDEDSTFCKKCGKKQ